MSAVANPSEKNTAATLRGRLRALARAAFAWRRGKASRLGIDALPEELASLMPGSLYVVYATPRLPGCDALVWQSAREARTRHVTVVMSCTRDEAAARLVELGFIEGVPVRGWPRRLNVLAMPGPAADRAIEDGNRTQGGEASASAFRLATAASATAAPAFARLVGGLRALKRFGFRARSLYFIEGAEQWFSWQDPAVLAQEGQWLADWCAQRKTTIVLLARPISSMAAGAAASAALALAGDAIAREARFDDDANYEGRREFHGACAGVARLRRVHGELLWHADFWRTGRALVTGEVRSLRFTDEGRLTVAPETATMQGARAAAMLARDEERVIATRAVVSNESWVPGEWEIVEDIDAALAACDGAVAATVLLDYTDANALEPLCAAVHRLRRQCGRALKIVVVERGHALRHQYELLLASLGTNLLLARDVPFSRMQSLLHSLQGQVDARPIVDDYRASLAAALTDAVRGYLPLDAFCSQVRSVLRRGELLRLPHVMAKLALLPSAAHVDALRHCVPRRTGDVFTADAGHLYVFLFACRLPDAQSTLARVFDAPVSRWSENVVFLAGEAIEHEIETIAEANRRSLAADYSDLFSEPSLPPIEPPREAQAKADALAQAEAQLQAVERALASLDENAPLDEYALGHIDEPSSRVPADGLRLSPPRGRHVEPCAMPLRATVEN